MKVLILGAGCPKCNSLEKKIREIDRHNHLNLVIEKVTDLQEMMRYGILMTPGLVVDGVLKCYGTIPSTEQLLQWFKEQPS
jgi:small redox-active disulfide protein 2